MSNPNPKTEQLALGRGKRTKLNHETVSMRMSLETKESLEAIASRYNCFYGGKPWIAGLLEKISKGELLIVPAPPAPQPQEKFNARQVIKHRLAKL